MTRPSTFDSACIRSAINKIIAAAALLASFVAVRSVQAATYSWLGNSSNWSLASNWGPGTVPGASDVAVFSGTFPNSPSLSSSSATSLGEFHATGSLAESFTMTLASLATLSFSGSGVASGIVIDDNGTVANNTVAFIGGNISLSASQTCTNNNTNGSGFEIPGSGDYSLTVASNVSLNNASTTLTLGGTGATQISGVISGAGSLLVNNGFALLSGSNSFGGAVSVSQGTLMVTSISNAGTVQPLGLSSTVTLGGATTPGVLYLMPSAGGDSTSLLVSLGAGGGTIYVAGSSDTFSGGITSNGGLNKAGPGILILTHTSAYTGLTGISAGTLQLGIGGGIAPSSSITIGNGAALLYTTTGFQTLSNNVSGGGTWTLAPNGGTSNVFTISGTNGSFAGTLNINSSASYSAANSYNLPGSSATINVNSGGQLQIGSVVGNSGLSISGSGGFGSEGALYFNSGGTWSGPITLTGNALIGYGNAPPVLTGNITGPYQANLRIDAYQRRSHRGSKQF
jgi:fibronectin-binding autotransporter adhesin